MPKTLSATFAEKLISWHARSGRSGLPWQGNRDPYAVWVSEIMLQQTQVTTVLERYPRFMKRFPTVQKLASAPIDDVLAEWAGLGYYSRARNLHTCAQQVMKDFGGQFPRDPHTLEKLKGVGRSTAGAIAAFAFHERAPILDANVKRILARLYAVEGVLQDKKTDDQLWQLAIDLLPKNAKDMPVYTQALMDFGATWCTARKPVCLGVEKKCPFEQSCQANLSNQVLVLPQKKTKTKSPEFISNMLLIRAGNFILLQKRPDKAIWGGLWSLPESPWTSKAAEQAVLVNTKSLLKEILPTENVNVWQPIFKKMTLSQRIKHVFTHRCLWIQVWSSEATQKTDLLDPSLKWISLNQLGRYGLPQPIKVLLQGLSPVRGDDLKN
ncbi:A/G-specific adenine glycosylase [Polynucleobacter sp.]|uniref:A/G-specific adenine glycosylase n=1 Tax=Polynucleobacter sp. TaxID=2029855 RepID=UPI0026027BC0|nr:A/G-specific adenine glycosylase [Polynucleobacter sp.]MCW1965222.1 A/G-specific adenine glycosylase [Polynucleobacter sp.]